MTTRIDFSLHSILCDKNAGSRPPALFIALLVLSGAFLPGVAAAQTDAEEELWARLRPGLLATYSPLAPPSSSVGNANAGEPAAMAERVDAQIAFVWKGQRPDARLSEGLFRGRWQGRLFTIVRGEYRMFVHAAGKVRLTLAGKTLIDAVLDSPGWLDGTPLTLSYGYHPLEVEYEPTAGSAQIALYWEGPNFRLEPVTARYFFHDPPAQPLGQFELGEQLAHALRCASCHRATGPAGIAGSAGLAPTRPLPAPSLANLKGNLHREWLVGWLKATPGNSAMDAATATVSGSSEAAPSRRMPHFPLSEADSEAIADYLLADGKPGSPAAGKPQDNAGSSSAAGIGNQAPSRGAKSPPPTIAKGRELFRTLGCLACHQAEGLGESGLFGGGSLVAVADKRPAGFFSIWLEKPESLNADHRMPVFRLTPDERTSLSLYLSSLGSSRPNSHAAAHEPRPERLAQGQRLVQDQRCAACHALPPGKNMAGESLATSGREDFATSLPAIGPQSRWDRSCLTPQASGAEGSDPETAPSAARTRPVYALTKQQAAAVQMYFTRVVPDSLGSQANRAGRKANEPRRKPEDDSSQFWAGPLALAERNCTACHARDAAPGIEPQLDAVLAASPELAPFLPGMKPPALHGVGDKLHRPALEDAIALRHPPLRPWLSVRMPKFNLAPAEQQALVDHLVAVDRIPPRLPSEGSAASTESAGSESPAHGFSDEALLVAGSRLVTSSGFGCTSCHQVGNAVPQKVELKSQGPDLSRLSERLRKSWFDRWMPNPARIVPRMEMPSVVNPIAGVLDENVQTQLAAVWHVLDLKEFNPPKPNPIRVVRRSNVPRLEERAVVLTDVLEVDEKLYLKPLIVGLPNRHNVLVDLEQNRLSLWWMGDTARQHTRGKSWYWEAGGSQLLPSKASSPDNPNGRSQQDTTDARRSELVLVRGDELRFPQMLGQFPTEFDWFEHSGGGVKFRHRLRFAGDMPGQMITLHVTQTIAPWEGEQPEIGGTERSLTGVRRTIQVQGVPLGWQLVLRGPRPAAAPVAAENDERSTSLGAILGGFSGGSFIRSLLPAEWAISAQSGGWPYLKAVATDDASAANAAALTFDMVYGTPLPADRYTVEPVELPQPQAANLDVVPGYAAVRLPLDASVMPTAIAWRPDGTLIVASLKGRVWLARDTNGDGLEDEIRPFSDELAAPYGVRAAANAIDVVNKYALLRLHDDDGDGFAERTETLASGWGHTADYHDWAVGLPRDAAGNYYLAIPCQQDQRSLAAAKHRGEALRLAPRQPTSDNPQRFAIESFCGGLRFPMGLALSRNEQLFATDNQGNYNPFNELNHLQPGRRYGFINKLEFRPDFKPPLTPPAVNLPHPWTRSVNGVCFLDTPDSAGGMANSKFGPFEGHLLGCEYDTRQLIRMSLDLVDGEYQGAAYPFTTMPDTDGAAAGEALEGPLACEVAPDGAIYVGNIRDSAWGGGANTGSLVRLSPRRVLPPGIAEVRALPNGFEVRFTAAVDGERAAARNSYKVSSYRRVSTPAYGGADMDRSEHAVRSVSVAPDGLSAKLTLDQLRAGFVYELRLENLAPGGGVFHPDEAHYSMNRVPR